jgi:uncharacterized protein DUF6878
MADEFPFDPNWVTDWHRQREEYKRVAIELLKDNKAALIGALGGTQITKITAGYNGSGDEGYIEEIEGCDAEGREILLPVSIVAIKSAQHQYKKAHTIETNELPFKEAIESLCYDLLQVECGGWEINEGTQGHFSFTLDAAASDGMKIEQEHEQNIMKTESSNYAW